MRNQRTTYLCMHTYTCICGDGHDSLDDQEAIIKVFNEDILGRLGEQHVISREVSMLGNNKVPYFVEDVEVGLTEERGGNVAVCLDLAAMMDTVDMLLIRRKPRVALA